jgi:hypothetical protein
MTSKRTKKTKTEVATTKPNLPATNGADPFISYGVSAASGGQFLKFTRGTFTLGSDGEEVPLGTRCAVNMNEVMVGHLKWVGGEVVDESMGRVVDRSRPAAREDLDDADSSTWERDESTGQPVDPWSLTNTVPMREVDGEREFTFSTSSQGGIKAVGKLCTAYGAQRLEHEDKVPVIELRSDSYRHRRYGQVDFPVFKIVAWRTEAELLSGEEPELELADSIPF